MKFTKEQIAAFKAAHPEGISLFETEDGKSCILHEPSRQDYSYIIACQDPVAANELIVKQLWVDGDEVIKNDFKYTVGVAAQATDTILKMKEFKVKKL